MVPNQAKAMERQQKGKNILVINILSSLMDKIF
jgi:hypothetical protein